MNLFEQADNSREQRKAMSLMQAAGQLFLESKYKEALQASEEALKIYQQLQDVQGVATATENLSGLNYHLGDYRKAVKYGRYSLQAARRIEDKDGMSRAFALLGGSYLFQGRSERSLFYHTQSLKLAQELGDVHGEIRALGNLGQVLAATGKYVDALKRIEQALARLYLEPHAGNDIFHVRLQNLQGVVYRVVGEHELANQSFRASLRKAQEIGDSMGISQSLINLGIGLLLQKKYEEAMGCFDDSLKIKELIGDPKGQGLALHNLGQCYEHLGRNEEAIKHFRRSLEIARQIDHREGEWQALGSIGIIYLKLKQPEQARQYLMDALRVARAVADNADVGEIYRQLAHVFIETKQYADAVSLLKESIAPAETIRFNLGIEENFKISIFERHVEAYRELQWALAEQGANEEALEIAERGRARALAETLIYRIRKRKLEEVSGTPPDLNEIRAIAAEHQTTFVVYSIVAHPLDYLTQATRDVEIFTWVVPPHEKGTVTFHRTGRLRLKDLAEKSDLIAASVGDTARRDLNFISQPGPDAPAEQEELRFLHRLLLEPVEDALPKDEDALVTFIADAGLFLIPFAALKDKRGKYLIESHTISLSPSIQTLHLTRHRRPTVETAADGKALVVGNPEMPAITVRLGQPPVKLNPLPYAEEEAISIASQLGTRALTGPDATKAAILPQLAQKRFIHLATHGIFDDLNNSRSLGAIALAPSGADDGLLTAEEIAGLELNAELAVLSACNTGQGRVAAEGVIGLSRAFITAGTPSVIVSLWAIPDAPTAFLMTQFYTGFVQPGSGLNKAQALRRAMLQTMKAHPKPQDWAAFVLLGDPR
jgi:CHAT domain-containing protein/Tfp pilus assembly protein PilF